MCEDGEAAEISYRHTDVLGNHPGRVCVCGQDRLGVAVAGLRQIHIPEPTATLRQVVKRHCIV